MGDTSSPQLRGLLVPDQRMSLIWDAESTYTQAGPQIGSVEPASADSRLTLEASGALDSGSSLDILTNRPGHPSSGGAFVWKKSTDAATLYRGRDPMAISGFDGPVEWNTAGAGTQQAGPTHCVALPNQTAIMIYERTAGGIPTVRVRTRVRDGAWSASINVYTGKALDDLQPCLCVLEDGSVLCAWWVIDTDVTPNEANVMVYRSTDDGATWARHSAAALTTPISAGTSIGSGQAGYARRRLRMASGGGQVLLMADLIANDTTGLTFRDAFRQYASDDLGASFSLVETTLGGLFLSHPCLLSVPGGFLVVYLTINTAISVVACRRMSDAFAPFSTADIVDIINGDTEFGVFDGTNKYTDDGDLAACVADDGSVYVLARATNDPTASLALNSGVIARSPDFGRSWAGMGVSSISDDGDMGLWYQIADANTYLTGFSVCYSEGRLVVPTNHSANPGTHDLSVSVVYIGGPSTVTMPGRGLAQLDTNRAVWDLDYLGGLDLPRDTCFNGVGAATETIVNGWLDFSATAGQSLFYYVDSSTMPQLAASIASGSLMVRYGLQMTAGGSSATDRQCVEVRLADGVNSYRVSLRHEAAGWALFDTLAGSRIGDAIVVIGELEFIVSLSAGAVATWYRARSLNADRQWIVGPASASLTDGGGAYATNRVLFGSKVTAGSTVSAKWFELHIAGASAGRGLSSGQTNPADLYPVAHAGPGFASYLANGASLTARGGPAFYGEAFSLASNYGYPLDQVRQVHSPSPRHRWRSTGVASQVTIAMSLGFGSPTTPAALYSDTLSVMAAGCNFRTGKIQGHDGATWQDLATLDTSSGISFTASFVRYGNTLVAASVPLTGEYYHTNEFAGYTAILSGSKWRRVVGNSEGSVLSASTAAKRLTIELEGVDGTEPTSAITVQLIPTTWACLVNLLGVKYAGFRLLIDAQTTADGYFELGSLLFGSLHAFGLQYSYGRVLETTPAVRSHTTADGFRTTNVIAPPARAVDIAWSEGILSDQVHDASAAPDYITASTSTGAKPIATARGTPWSLEGLIAGMFRAGAGGNAGVVGYVPFLDRVTDGNDATIINRRHQLIIGFCDQPIRLETIQGAEGQDELVRTAMSIREIV